MPEPTILIVEDEAELAYSLRQALQGRGYRSQTAVNGFEALGILQTTPPAAVILDLNLPGVSGLELLQRIRRLCPESQILVVTAHAQDYSRLVDQLGVAEVLQKPVTLDVLLERITRLVPTPVPPS